MDVFPRHRGAKWRLPGYLRRALKTLCTSRDDARYDSSNPIFELQIGGYNRYGKRHKHPQFMLLVGSDEPGDDDQNDDQEEPVASTPPQSSVPAGSFGSARSGADEARSAGPASYENGRVAAPPVESASEPAPKLTPEEAAEQLKRYQTASNIVREEMDPELERLKAMPNLNTAIPLPGPPLIYYELSDLRDSLRYPTNDNPCYVTNVVLLPLLVRINDRLAASGLADTLQGKALAEVVRLLSEHTSPSP